MEGNILDAMRYVGAGLAMIGAAGAGVGIGLSVQGALGGMARNPDTYGNLLTNMILGIAFSEAIRNAMTRQLMALRFPRPLPSTAWSLRS